MLIPRLTPLLVLCAVGMQANSYSLSFEQSIRLPSKLPGTDSRLFVFNDEQYQSGFIDANGTVVVAPSFEGHVGDFVDGLANVTGAGYIDERGNWVIQGDFVTTDDFSDGLAKVEFEQDNGSEQNVSYVDQTGRVVFRASRFRTGDFSEGMAWYQAEGAPSGEMVPIGSRMIEQSYPGLFGFVDRTGALAIEPQFYGVGSFEEGLARASPAGHCYVNTREGPAPIAIPWVRFSMLGGGGRSTGLGTVCPVGFIDLSGEFKIGPRFEAALDFAEDRAAILIDGGWGYIDRDGNVVVEPRYGQVRSFREGLAVVELDEKWGFIDANGQVVIEPRFTWADSFSDSLALAGRIVEGNEERFYMDRQGQIAILGPFADATPFVNGLASVRYPNQDDEDEADISYINKLGTVVFSYPF